jgi:hypothetical protein
MFTSGDRESAMGSTKRSHLKASNTAGGGLRKYREFKGTAGGGLTMTMSLPAVTAPSPDLDATMTSSTEAKLRDEPVETASERP